MDEYLARIDEPARGALTRLRRQIRKGAPMAREVISYQMPTYLHHGALLHFAAWSKHLALYAVSPSTLESLKDALKPFNVRGHTIHFRAEKPLPAAVVAKIVKDRLEENEARRKV